MKLIIIAISVVFLNSCSQSLTIPSLKSIPPIPEGKSRVVHIFKDSPNMWKIMPIYISVNGRPADKVHLKKVSYLDVKPGQNLFSYQQKKALGVRDGMSLNFFPGQTRYLYLKPHLKSFGYYSEYFSLDVSELNRFQAENLITQN